MKKLLLALLLAVAVTGCEREKPAPIAVPQQTPINAENEIRLLKGVLGQDPANLPALIKLGNIMMDTGRFNEAIDAYGKALAIDPKNVDVRVDMGTCYRNTGRPDKAVEEFRKALSINPNHLYAHKNLGVTLAYNLGDRAGAIKELEEYLRLSPNAPDAFQTKGAIEELKKMTPK